MSGVSKKLPSKKVRIGDVQPEPIQEPPTLSDSEGEEDDDYDSNADDDDNTGAAGGMDDECSIIDDTDVSPSQAIEDLIPRMMNKTAKTTPATKTKRRQKVIYPVTNSCFWRLISY